MAGRPSALRAFCTAGLLALLAGCATAPPAPVATIEPPLPYPPSARERMLHIAMAEWADWGCITNEETTPGSATPALPMDPPATPCLAGPEPLAQPATHAESRPDNFPRVLAYWRAVPEGTGPITRNRALYASALADPAGGSAIWAEPAWSAAFISYVMRNAGVDRREFPPSAAHAFYIDAMLADATRFPATAPFIPREPAGYAPRQGDLICADRSRRPLADWRDRLAEIGQFRPMHCDIVTTAITGSVEVIGGNVGDAVTLSRFPTDSAGRLFPRATGRPTWVVIFENRLGRLPPWGIAGTTAP